MKTNFDTNINVQDSSRESIFYNQDMLREYHKNIMNLNEPVQYFIPSPN